MREHQRETAFVRHCLRYDDAPERHQLEERLAEIDRKERLVRRAVWLMVLLVALAVAGLCYWAIFMTDRPRNVSQFTTPVISKTFCELGLGSLICLVAFLGLGVLYRKQLQRRREECRRMATSFLESRLGPQTESANTDQLPKKENPIDTTK